MKSFFRYLLVQITAYGLDMGGFLLTLKLLGDWPLLANVFGKTIAGIFAFLAHRSFTFSAAPQTQACQQMVKYFLLLALNLPISSAVLSIMMLLVNPEVLAKFLADVICVLLTYWVSKKYIFSSSSAVDTDLTPRKRWGL